ncbi:hypothetical protein AGR1B_pa0151 [Agrobacterium fabacearum S56]|nr:hypothetical protein AGR1B_pa0151 [Agrobacterium fabacearum S56]
MISALAVTDPSNTADIYAREIRLRTLMIASKDAVSASMGEMLASQAALATGLKSEIASSTIVKFRL